MLCAWRIGWWVGSAKSFEGKEPPAEKLGEAVFALLGLLLAFAFGMALQKYEHRRERMVGHSNAIGDFFTCASLLDKPLRNQLQDVIRRYTRLVVKAHDDLHDPAAWEDDRRQAAECTADMTNLVRQAGKGGSPFTVPLTETLNEVGSAEAARLSASEDRMPTVVVLLLMVTSTLSIGLTAWRQGAVGAPQRLGILVVIAICAMVIYVILDLDQPTRGLIRVNQGPFIRLERSMGK
jgi:hypothetical protein